MSASLKHKLKQVLISRQHRKYRQEVRKREISYAQWVGEEEKGLRPLPLTKAFVRIEDMTFFHIKAEESMDAGADTAEAFGKLLEQNPADIYLFTFYAGEVNEITVPLLYRRFKKNEHILLIYGDEDSLENGQRHNPWLKPDWSPDTFLSGFYLGGLVAVRGGCLRKAYGSLGKEGVLTKSGGDFFYHLFYLLLKDNQAFCQGHDEGKLPVYHLPGILFHSTDKAQGRIRDWSLSLKQEAGENCSEEEAEREKAYLSIIIPSKDNPDVLFQCLDSLVRITKTENPYEILVIDNGSSLENKERIQEKVDMLNRLAEKRKERQEGGLWESRYFYEPMPFNFSQMCNLGARQAGGSILLFLNDDMEIIQPDWLDLLLKKVRLPYVGAVGAKLLYPQSTIIQHAGITNLRIGPAHKLQFLDDSLEYYFGKNRGVHNMLAVTGACLMVRREVFEQVGEFAEVLPVAFNDVDLCYSIYEAGYYNVVRNDVVLYHHESLSRGNDGESVEKQMRLMREKDILYERHQKLYGKDPFYHPRLEMDILKSEYCCALFYRNNMDIPLSPVHDAVSRVAKSREDKCLVVGMECATDIYKWRFGISYKKRGREPREEDKGYYFQGYSFVIGADNACYKKQLLLKNRQTKEVLGIKLERQYRPDIHKGLADQHNVELTGFAVKIKRDELKAGCYQFGILAEDTCSAQKLVNWSNWVLEVTEEGVTQEVENI